MRSDFVIYEYKERNMSGILLKRLLAFAIDLVLIVGYAVVLFQGVQLIILAGDGSISISPIVGQLIGFLSLTQPVFVYSYLTERGAWKGTVGKRMQNLMVITDQNAGKRAILIRNILKFLPWEIAHTGVHWTVYYASLGIENPPWTWVVLILPQVAVVLYFISILVSKGYRCIYDRLAGTKVVERRTKLTILNAE